jgi:hypothetical protein
VAGGRRGNRESRKELEGKKSSKREKTREGTSHSQVTSDTHGTRPRLVIYIYLSIENAFT